MEELERERQQKEKEMMEAAIKCQQTILTQLPCSEIASAPLE